MKARRSIIGATIAFLAASALLMAAVGAAASPPSITNLGAGSAGTAPLTGVCASTITVDAFDNSNTQTEFFDNNGDLTALTDRFVEVDTFIGPTGETLLGDPYQAVAEVRFDKSGDVTSSYLSGVLEKVTLPDGTTALFAGRLNGLTASPGSFVFTPDNGHSSNLAGFCAALDAGQPAF